MVFCVSASCWRPSSLGAGGGGEMVSARRGWGTQRANPGAPAAQSLCPVPRGPSTQWATTGAPEAFCGATSARRGSGTRGANPGAPAARRLCPSTLRGPTSGPPLGPLRRSVEPPVPAGDQAPGAPTLRPLQRAAYVRPRSGDPAPSGPPLGPLMCSVEPPVPAGDQAPGAPTLGPLRHSAVVRLRPGDPAPSGPSLGPLRHPVERNGGLGKGRNLRQNRGGQNQGQRRGHSAA